MPACAQLPRERARADAPLGLRPRGA